MYRLRHLNAAEADQARGLRSLRHPRQNRAGHLHAGWARVQVRLVVRKIFHRKVTTKGFHVSGSARRRLLAQVKVGSVVEVGRLDCVNQSRRLLVAEPRVRRAAKEKEFRALMVSRLRHNSASSRSRRSSRSRVARLPQPIAARHKDSRKVGTRDNQKKRHRHSHNNFGAITPAAPE